MNIQEILKCLPHRSPFLMVDKVIAYRLKESITALKLCSYNEPCLNKGITKGEYNG